MLPDGSINPGEMISFNHYALGAVTQWLLTELASLAVSAPGGSALRVAPVVGHGFSRASMVHRLAVGTAALLAPRAYQSQWGNAAAEVKV